MRSVHLVVIVATLVAAPNAVLCAQRQTTVLDAATRGLALIDSAIAANGGVERLRAIDDITVRYRGRRWMTWQSERASAPWNIQPTLTDLVVDIRNNRLMRHGVTRYPADFAFVSTQIMSGPNAQFFDPTRAGYNDVVSRATGPANAVAGSRRELPALELLQVLERTESIRWVGERTDRGARLQGVSYAQPNGAIYTLWIDAATKRLTRLEWLADDPVEGDQLRSYDYSGYRVQSGVPLPARLVERRNGEIVRDDTLAITFNDHPGDAVFTAPTTGYLEPGPLPAAEREPVRKLAENVWLLQQLPGGNRVMFVAFRDYVMVVEAPTPQSAADSVLAIVRRTVPGKRVRYVAFSHHHDDHGGGLRPYIAQGATIVTTPQTRAFVEKVAGATHRMRPDALSLAPRAPVIETFTKKRVFTDGDMTVELHDIGPTSHVNEITMAYLPKERLVFQGDLIIIPPRGDVAPANMLTAEFAQAVDRLKLDVETIVGVPGRVGTMADLRDAMAKRRP
jgi:glyoxylase-like metal-dependent hydrolase (beta-lactamase superfamily II)